MNARSKRNYLGVSLLVKDENVLGFEISVDEILVVHELNGRQDRREDLLRHILADSCKMCFRIRRRFSQDALRLSSFFQKFRGAPGVARSGSGRRRRRRTWRPRTLGIHRRRSV